MASIGRWNGFKFKMSPSIIRGFTGLKIKGSCETKEKTKSKQGYVKRKNGKPAEVSLNVVLHAALGCDVRTDALKLVSDATAGEKDYFYVGNSKLMACKLMLVEAQIQEVTVGTGDTWVAAEVAMSMKQCDKGGATSSSSGKKKSKKQSVKKSNTKKTKTPATTKKDEVDAITGAAPSVAKMQAKVQQTAKKLVTGAVQAISKITAAAKKLTASKKTTTPVTKPSSASRRISGTTM